MVLLLAGDVPIDIHKMDFTEILPYVCGASFQTRGVVFLLFYSLVHIIHAVRCCLPEIPYLMYLAGFGWAPSLTRKQVIRGKWSESKFGWRNANVLFLALCRLLACRTGA